jgi:cytochrome c oxidase cbb3-type subunit 4
MNLNVNLLREAVTIACFILFAGIVVWAYARRNRQRFDEAARLPFAESKVE